VTTAAGAAGAAGLAGSSCAYLGLDALVRDPGPPLPAMGSYLARFDRGLQRLADWSLGEVTKNEAIPAAEDELARAALRSLYVTAMFGDLPEAGQMHPGMQARVQRALPEMDQAVFGMCDRLEQCRPDEADELQRVLKQPSNPGMELAQQIDQLAAETGMSPGRRVQTRSMTTQLAARLRNQPPRTAFAEHVGKTRRLAARAGSVEEIQRRMIAQLGEQAFWERQQRLARYAAAWQEQGATSDGGGVEDLPADQLADAGAVAGEEVADAGTTADALPPEAEAPPAGAPSDEVAAGGQKLVTLTPAQLEEILSQTERQVEQEARAEWTAARKGLAGWTLGLGALTMAAGTALVFVPTIPTFIIGVNIVTMGAAALLLGLIFVAVANGRESE
jgi:hypothetical protein